MRKGLRLPVSDLRVLDPAYTSPRRGCILARDKCIVICLEHVRAVVMRDCALVPLERGAAAAPLQAAAVAALERAVAEYASPASEAAEVPGACGRAGVLHAGRALFARRVAVHKKPNNGAISAPAAMQWRCAESDRVTELELASSARPSALEEGVSAALATPVSRPGTPASAARGLSGAPAATSLPRGVSVTVDAGHASAAALDDAASQGAQRSLRF